MQTITVQLGERSYPIHIENGILDRTGEWFARTLGSARAAIVTDDHVAPLYLARVERSLSESGAGFSSIVLPHGEHTKCLDALQKLYTFLCAGRFTRRDVVIALGGGVIGDLAGFAAATYLRGVRFLQLPTTLLAQVDSSVGGKVAVDLPEGKNLVGAFWQPSLVLCDPLALNSLTDDYWHDGLGEVVKYGCINDARLFSLLEECAPAGRDALMGRMDEILSHCIRAKADVVAQDEHDTGLRMTLNFGHTIAHAIEKCQHYDGLRHGEAVAVGMSMITRLTEGMGLTEAGTADRLDALLRALGLPLRQGGIPESEMIAAMGMDKKNLGNSLHVIVLDRIGQCGIRATGSGFFTGMCSL